MQADDSPEYFARLLEGTDKEVLADEMTALRDKLMYQPHAWLDAFIAAKGTTKRPSLSPFQLKQPQWLIDLLFVVHPQALSTCSLCSRGTRSSCDM